jgi:imidazolonepropionase-like amidohydrolase/Tol biopolymer transport system component
MRSRCALGLTLVLGLLGLPAFGHGGHHPNALDKHRHVTVEAAAQDPVAPVPEPVAEKPKEEEKWDVEKPPGDARTVPIDVREGTWLSLDVSPDGREIVFDLLGDLYLLPIEGGEARALTTGWSWDMQPRFSPDGTKIAFTSDRGGGDNVWTIDRDGTNAKAVTSESFRLLNSPVWTPDGEYLVARKHFTGTRSLGSGEMWLYHRTGGGGAALTTKPNDQKDVGEPAVSPDGRYVYYSLDATPGRFFEYNKDPYAGIYAIERLDRRTGEIETVTGGSGGACRPTPSPDGTRLAFVRRSGDKTVLYLRELATGEEWPLYDGLDRDMQETWAIHGVYPAIAWTPDGRAIVFWAAGRLQRVDVATQITSDIPFHVVASRSVLPSLRFPVDVAPAQFEVKMLRFVEVSPAGDKVLFQALGKLWQRDLPDGAVRRLTTQETHGEYFGSFAKDGAAVVFTTWDDRELGSVRIVDLATGEERVVVTEPGHYAEPRLSPDGAWVVYQKLGGGGLRSPLFGDKPGIYRVATAGGTPERVTENGSDAHFGPESDRVYLFRRPERESQLVSIGLDGPSEKRAERVEATASNAVRFRVSPDGKWLAWQERFHVYVTAFPATGRSLSLTPGGKALPTAKVTRDAGDDLHWSGDSLALHWVLGPELFTRPLTDSFAFLAGATEKLPEPPATGQRIGFAAASDAPTGVVAITGGQVLTMAGERGREVVIDDGVVLVEGHRITAVGRAGEVEIPAGAHVIDARGKTVMPGLVDVHWHGSQGQDEIQPETSWVNLASLGFGVTTLHDPSNDTSEIFASAELARAGLTLAPRIFSTGTILYGAETPFMAEVSDLESARTHLRRMKAVGAISVKSYNQPRRDQRQQVVTAARELGMMVVPEGGSLFQHNMTMVVDGHTGIEHSIPVGAIYEDVRQLWGATDVAYTPTLVVGYGGLWGENYWYAKTEVWKHPRLLGFVPKEELDGRSRRRVTAADGDWNHFHNAGIAADLMRRGVKVQIGAHGQREGLAAHWEIWMLVQGGMTPHEALRAATKDGAHYLGLDGDLGSLEPGKLADILILDKDPLADIRNSEAVETVILNGRVYDAARLDQVYPEVEPREPLWFERGADGRLLVAPGR